MEQPQTQSSRGPRRAPRGGNALVKDAVAGLEGDGSMEAGGDIAAEAAAAATESAAAEAAAAVAETEARREAVSLTGAGESEPYNPFERPAATPPAPAPKVRKDEAQADRQSRQATPSTKRFGSLGKKLPGAERAKVHKRADSGQLAYIGEYTESDMSQSQDMESFLNRYIKPMYGPGEYQITGVDAHGRQFDMGTVQLMAPILGAPALPEQQLDSPLALVRDMVNRTLQSLQTQPQPQQQDPLRMMEQLHDLKLKMDPPKTEGPKDNALAIAIVSGVTTIASSALALMLQPKAMDPLTALMLKKMVDEEPKRSAAPASPMPSITLPAPVDPTEQLKNIVSVVRELNGGGAPKSADDRLVDYLMKDRMTPGDVIKLVQEAKGERGTDDLKKSVENIGIMLNAVAQLRSQTEPGAGAGFWDALGALANNPGLGGLIGDALRTRRGGPATVQVNQPPPQQVQQQQSRVLPPPPQPGQPMDPIVAKARELAVRKLLIEEAELNEREKRLAAAGIPVQKLPSTAPLPQQVQQPAAPVQQPQVVAPAPLAAVEAAAVAEAPQAAPVAPVSVPTAPQGMPPLPSDIGDYVNRYLASDEEAALVETTIDLLSAMVKTEGWKQYVELVYDLIAKSDKARFLHYMASLFIGLQGIKVISPEIAEKVMAALQSNFEIIVEMVQLQMSGEGSEGDDGEAGDEGEGGEDGEGDGEGGDGEDPDDHLQLGTEEPLTSKV